MFEKEGLNKLGLNDLPKLIRDSFLAETPEGRKEIARQVSEIAGKFKTDFSKKPLEVPPVGNFQSPADDSAPLTTDRLMEMIETFQKKIKAGELEEFDKQKIRLVYDGIIVVANTYKNAKSFYSKSSISAFSNMRT